MSVCDAELPLPLPIASIIAAIVGMYLISNAPPCRFLYHILEYCNQSELTMAAMPS